ncbi:MAG: AI-2E family transporter [Sulfurimonas sp.]
MKVDKYNNSILASMAYLVILIAGLKAGSNLIVPLLMAFFWFLLFLPLIDKLRSFGMLDIFTTIIVFGITLGIVALMGTFLVISGQDMIANLPVYQERYYELLPKVAVFFEKFGITMERSYIENLFDPIQIINYMATFLKEMGGIMTDGLLTLFIVLFLFLESSLLSKKVLYLAKRKDAKKKIELFLHNVNTYFLTKTAISILTGLLIYAILAFVGLDNAPLFGFLAFLLNYIPNIGSIMAAIPAILVSLLLLTITETVFIVTGYILVNSVIGNILEPKLLSRGVGLSTLVVFLSMVFWGWVFGPVGMFLSVPLTTVMKIGCDDSLNLKWASVLLGDKIK